MKNSDLITVIEIPKGSKYKYERDENGLYIDRVLNIAYPENYGYFNGTLAADGDALDCFVISNEPIHPLSRCPVEMRSAYLCLDNGVRDDKIICTLVGEKLDKKEVMIRELEICVFLENYKQNFKVIDVVDSLSALKLFKSCQKTSL